MMKPRLVTQLVKGELGFELLILPLMKFLTTVNLLPFYLVETLLWLICLKGIFENAKSVLSQCYLYHSNKAMRIKLHNTCKGPGTE